MPKYDRAIILATTDWHGDHELGLMNPETELEIEDQASGDIQKYIPKLNANQEYLWKIQEKAISEASYIAGKDDIVVLHEGDITQGGKHNSELVSNTEANQEEIAFRDFDPICKLKNVKAIRLCKGTGSHVFGNGSSERRVAKRLQLAYPKIDTKTLYHGLATVKGLTIDYSHHGAPPGSRNWLRGNEFRYYLRSLVQDELDLGNVPPNLVLRGHYHTPTKEVFIKRTDGHLYETMGYLLPSMCMMDDYARKASRSGFIVTNGYIVFEVLNGKIYQTIELTQTTDLRIKETIL